MIRTKFKSVVRTVGNKPLKHIWRDEGRLILLKYVVIMSMDFAEGDGISCKNTASSGYNEKRKLLKLSSEISVMNLAVCVSRVTLGDLHTPPGTELKPTFGGTLARQTMKKPDRNQTASDE